MRRVYSRCVFEVARGLLPDLVNGVYDYLMVDLASIAYGFKDPRAFLVNVRLAIDYGYLKPNVIFVIDYSRPKHRAVVWVVRCLSTSLPNCSALLIQLRIP